MMPPTRSKLAYASPMGPILVLHPTRSKPQNLFKLAFPPVSGLSGHNTRGTMVAAMDCQIVSPYANGCLLGTWYIVSATSHPWFIRREVKNKVAGLRTDEGSESRSETRSRKKVASAPPCLQLLS